MRYGVTLGILAFALIYLGLQANSASWLWLWSGASFLIVSAGYLRLGTRVFGKRADGTIALWAVGLLLPYLLLTWTLWHLQRWFSKEAACNEVVPGLWIGRRPLGGELPSDILLVVDLTAEFPAVRQIRNGQAYRCLPMLDASVPDVEALYELVRMIAAWPEGGIYVHCAMGHGRSAMVVMAVLLANGLAQDVVGAEERVRKVRPQIGLDPCQRRLLEQAAWLPIGVSE